MFYRAKNRIPKISGFTLVEALVVIGLNTALMAVIMSTVTQLYKNNSYSFEQANEIEVARRGMSEWVRDAREMNAATNGAFPLAELSSTTMGFYSDVDKDASVEYVKYVLSSTTLKKYIYNPVGYPATYSTSTPDSIHTLSTFVQNIKQSQKTFTYYSDMGAEITNPASFISDVSYISLKLIVNIDPVRSPGEFMLQGSVAPRNIKTNL